ncbi:MAG: dienelactone hydrolase family protein [Paludibacteraceae bacterium]|nr:dienelactone hydrolase family protein [Paludibacteraceae bacterium]
MYKETMYNIRRSILLLLIVCSQYLSAQSFEADRYLFDAYRKQDMSVWKEYVDSLQHGQTCGSDRHLLLYEYGYCGYIVAEAKQAGKEALLPEAKQYVQLFKADVESRKDRLPKGHYEMYMSAVYVYELRLKESVHPLKAMNLAKEATQLAPDDPLVVSYYGTCMFYAPKPFGSKAEALKWFERAEVLFRAPQWQNCWVREATLMYIHQCHEKLGHTPVADHKAQRLLLPQSPMPEGGWPAVLLLHDHGARFEKGWAKVIGRNPEPYYNGMAIGDSLAAHGYVVYCADAPYWGSRRSALSQRAFSDSLGGVGEWYQRVLEEDRAGADYLRSLPFVNPDRIAVAGFSYGAYRAWNLAAEEPHIKACIAAHWMTTLAQNRYNDSWLCMVRKGIYPADSDERTQGEWKEFAAIAATIAPRPFLLQYGLHDKLFPVAAVDSCVRYIDSVYSNCEGLMGKRLEVEAYDCGHEMTHRHWESWLRFLKTHL